MIIIDIKTVHGNRNSMWRISKYIYHNVTMVVLYDFLKGSQKKSVTCELKRITKKFINNLVVLIFVVCRISSFETSEVLFVCSVIYIYNAGILIQQQLIIYL